MATLHSSDPAAFAPPPRQGLSREELAGLAVALAAHIGLVAWLTLKPPAPAPLPVPERMTVTLSDDVAERSTSPDPAAHAAAAVAPVISDKPVPEPAPQPVPPPVPQPRAQPAPAPLPRAMPQPAPRPAARPVPPRAVPVPAKTPPARPVSRPGGASRLGSDFLKGVTGGDTPAARSNAPAAQTIGPAVRSALSGAITRQLKPKWSAPSGADADELVTVLAWDLNPDGSLAGSPRLVSQSGITDANRAQAQRHAEQAIRAVRLAAPFDLPNDLYAAWKHVASFRFDRKLSQ